jgi:RHS repeat-associated protein
MQMPGRNHDATEDMYRYGFNGMEADKQIKGERNSYTTEFRQYDPRVARWLSLDPITHYDFSPYNAFDNSPIYWIDRTGSNSTPPDNFLIKKDGSMEQQKTQDNFDVFYLENDNGSADEIARMDKNENGLIALPSSFKSENGKIGFKYTGSVNENYIAPSAFAGLLGALNQAGVNDLSLNHWSNADGSTPSPSRSHKEGKVGDLRPLRTDKTGAGVLVTDPEFDKARNASLIGGMKSYGWSSILSERDKSGYITPGTTHYSGYPDKTGKWVSVRHNNHFHVQSFKPALSVVNEFSISIQSGKILNQGELPTVNVSAKSQGAALPTRPAAPIPLDLN